MNKKNIIFRIFLTIFCLSGFLTEAFSQDDLRKQVQDLISATDEDLNIGIYVENLDTKEVKLAIHQNRKFIPASATKLFTAYAALDYLGKDFQFQTMIISDGKIQNNNSLNGNLYIKFSGDPMLSYKDLENMIKSLNIAIIKGDVILDKTIFDEHTTSPGGFAWDDSPFCYAAPKSAIIIDNNCGEATMSPHKKKSGVAEIEIASPCVLNITNNVDVVKPRKENAYCKSRYLGNNHYEVYGSMLHDTKQPIRLNFALPDNKLMAKNYIENILKDLNIKISGQIKFEKATGKNVLYVHKSPHLETFLIPIMHDSMNLASASLFNYMGYKYTGTQGSDESGEMMMKNFLRKKGIESAHIHDGSGESSYNLVTPKTLVQLLHSAYSSKKTRGPFLAVLPQCGTGGSLKYRNVDDKYNKDIYAKTGSFRNASALSGYYLPPDKKSQYAFAIMSNNHTLGHQRIKDLEDKILSLILNN